MGRRVCCSFGSYGPCTSDYVVVSVLMVVDWRICGSFGSYGPWTSDYVVVSVLMVRGLATMW